VIGSIIGSMPVSSRTVATHIVLEPDMAGPMTTLPDSPSAWASTTCRVRLNRMSGQPAACAPVISTTDPHRYGASPEARNATSVGQDRSAHLDIVII
jgi:hypothetical protein